MLGSAAAQGELQFYRIVGDEIPASLTGTGGDPARGRSIVVDRRPGACLLCHSGPFPEEKFQEIWRPTWPVWGRAGRQVRCGCG
jgi:L-cysteine S-thiosulfotransferase